MKPQRDLLHLAFNVDSDGEVHIEAIYEGARWGIVLSRQEPSWFVIFPDGTSASGEMWEVQELRDALARFIRNS